MVAIGGRVDNPETMPGIDLSIVSLGELSFRLGPVKWPILTGVRAKRHGGTRDE
jgi:hypothetical protein